MNEVSQEELWFKRMFPSQAERITEMYITELIKHENIEQMVEQLEDKLTLSKTEKIALKVLKLIHREMKK